MSFGLQIWDRSARLMVDTTTIAWNLADVAAIPKGSLYNKRFDELKDYEFMTSIMINGVVDYGVSLSTPMPVVSLGADGITTVTVPPANVETIVIVMAR